uniref:Uncharacterized protein n=1 Tax=Arundo donax TaxID=35708 RepID=A0A0A8YVC7_ARUDO
MASPSPLLGSGPHEG